MARPLRLDAEGAVHHVVVRGNERRAIFRDDLDRELYLKRLAEYREKHGFRLLAFCLMGNHVHLAVETGRVPLSRVMHGLQSSYTQAFNRRHGRVGHLFQGRYKAFLVEKERYLLALVKYIHDNPVRASLVRRAADYPWSSDRYYRRGEGPAWLDMDPVLSTLSGRRSSGAARYREFMGGEQEESYEEAPEQGGVIKGSDEFAVRVLKGGDSMRRLGARGLTVERVAATVSDVQGISLVELKSPGRFRANALARALAGYVGRLRGIPVARMARYFRRDESSLVRGVLGVEEKLRGNVQLRGRIAEVERRLE